VYLSDRNLQTPFVFELLKGKGEQTIVCPTSLLGGLSTTPSSTGALEKSIVEEASVAENKKVLASLIRMTPCWLHPPKMTLFWLHPPKMTLIWWSMIALIDFASDLPPVCNIQEKIVTSYTYLVQRHIFTNITSTEKKVAMIIFLNFIIEDFERLLKITQSV
jgi:hypothetical protein